MFSHGDVSKVTCVDFGGPIRYAGIHFRGVVTFGNEFSISMGRIATFQWDGVSLLFVRTIGKQSYCFVDPTPSLGPYSDALVCGRIGRCPSPYCTSRHVSCSLLSLIGVIYR